MADSPSTSKAGTIRGLSIATIVIAVLEILLLAVFCVCSGAFADAIMAHPEWVSTSAEDNLVWEQIMADPQVQQSLADAAAQGATTAELTALSLASAIYILAAVVAVLAIFPIFSIIAAIFGILQYKNPDRLKAGMVLSIISVILDLITMRWIVMVLQLVTAVQQANAKKEAVQVTIPSGVNLTGQMPPVV